MKKVVISRDEPTITVENVTTDNVYAYVTGGGRLFVLSRLGAKHVPNKHGEFHYGFVPISKTNDVPNFLGIDAKQSITKASNSGNTVMEFNNFTDLMKWKLKIED